MLKFNYLDSLNKINCPVLLIAGAESPMHPPKRMEEMAEKIDPKWVTFKIFKEAGAPVYREFPAETFETVKQFLLS